MDRTKQDTIALYFAVAGLVWGLFEATWFFIVPDVLLCFAALRSYRAAGLAVIGVVLGSLAGACLIHAYFIQVGAGFTAGYYALHGLWSLFPGFTPKMALVARGQLSLAGSAKGLIYGPSSGIPYRVYVTEALRLGMPIGSILAWTVPARLERVLIAPLIVLALKSLVDRWIAPRFPRISESTWRRGLVVAVVVYWIVLYAWYWGRLVPANYG